MLHNPAIDKLSYQNSQNGLVTPLSAVGVKEAVKKIGMTLGSLQQMQLEKPVEVITGLSKRQIGLLNAPTNAGKTTLVRNAFLAGGCGREFLPFLACGQPIRTVYIDNEDSRPSLKYDLKTMLQNLSAEERDMAEKNVLILCEDQIKNEDIKINNPDHFQVLVETITNHAADLIVIDTLSRSFVIRNENDNSEIMEQVIEPLRRLSVLTETAILTVHHIGKAKQEEGQSREAVHRGRGASNLAGQHRVIYNLDRDFVNDRLILSCPKRKGPFVNDHVFILDPEKRWMTVEREAKLTTSYDLLLEMFDDGAEFKTAEIVESFTGHVAKRQVMENLSRATKCGHLEKAKHGVYRKGRFLQAENESAESAEHIRDCTTAL